MGSIGRLFVFPLEPDPFGWSQTMRIAMRNAMRSATGNRAAMVAAVWALAQAPGGAAWAQDAATTPPAGATAPSTSAASPVADATTPAPTTTPTPPASAGPDAAKTAIPPKEDKGWISPLLEGDPTLFIRLRAEWADSATLRNSAAYTAAVRLGYGSKPVQGFKAYGEFEGVFAADRSLYNGAGVSGDATRTVIADPPVIDLNQAYGEWDSKGTELDVFPILIRAGRQGFNLDDQRFIGTVAWRQNDQTFDAATVKVTPIPGLDAQYGFIWGVNRIFGQGVAELPAPAQDFESNSHFVNVTQDIFGVAKLTGFVYLLDFDNSAANSSNTYGVRATSAIPLAQDLKLNLAGSFAFQTDGGDNPVNYDAPYVAGEASLTYLNFTAGAGYELLGSDGRDGVNNEFRTPLATLHKFQGYADAFLVTPDGGIDDLYAFANVKLPYDVSAEVAYHYFTGVSDGTGELGQELDVVVSHKINKNLAVLVKYAQLEGDGPTKDLRRIWLQLEFKD